MRQNILRHIPYSITSDLLPLRKSCTQWKIERRIVPPVVTQLLHSCYTVVTQLLHSCYTVVTQLLHCCYIVVTLLLQLLHCRYTVFTMLSTIVTVVHTVEGRQENRAACCHIVVTLLLHGCYTVVTRSESRAHSGKLKGDPCHLNKAANLIRRTNFIMKSILYKNRQETISRIS
jgi:hypothetical protein